MAEGVGFEPTRAFALPVFKTGAINHSTTPPRRQRWGNCATRNELSKPSPRVPFPAKSSLDR